MWYCRKTDISVKSLMINQLSKLRQADHITLTALRVLAYWTRILMKHTNGKWINADIINKKDCLKYAFSWFSSSSSWLWYRICKNRLVTQVIGTYDGEVFPISTTIILWVLLWLRISARSNVSLRTMCISFPSICLVDVLNLFPY